MITHSIYAIMATLGYCIIFNIRGKKISIASLGGGITWLFYLITFHYSNSDILAIFTASLAAGIYSEIMARVLKSPVTAFVICAVIPLVPGGGMYYTMLETVQGNINQSLNIGLVTLSSAGAIAVGILLVSSVTKILLFWGKSRKQKTF